MLSVVMYGIFTNICLTLGYVYPDTLPVYYLPEKLLVNYLLAFALALGVNLVILPVTSRTIFFVLPLLAMFMKRSYTSYLEAASSLLKAHSTFLTPPDNYRMKEHEAALAKAMQAVRAASVKISADKSYAKRELAYGAISTDQLSELYKLGRKIIWPLLGVGTVAGIVTEIANSGDEYKVDDPEPGHADIVKAVKVLYPPTQALSSILQEGIEHVLCTLRLGKHAKPSPLVRLFSTKSNPATDDERAQDIGTDAFLQRFDAGVESFQSQRTKNLDQFYDVKRVVPSQGLFLVLFVEFLLMAVAQEIRTLIVFVDGLRAQGAITRKLFIVPKMKVLRKALQTIFNSRGSQDIVSEGYGDAENFTGRVNRILAVEILTIETPMEPEKTMPIIKGVFSILASITSFFQSDHALFGLRAAAATIAGTIPAFLQNSATFYTQYRGVWIPITIILVMSPTTGASLNGFVWRCVGTLVGGMGDMAVWYMVDQKVAGAIALSVVVLAFRNSLERSAN